MFRFIALTLALCFVLALSASAVQNAGPTWNTLCATYHFDSYPQAASTTFGDAYHGSNFNIDIALITAELNRILASKLAPPNIDDSLNAELENWPDSVY